MPNIRVEKIISPWVDRAEAAAMVGVSESSITRWTELRLFPQPHRRGIRTFRWRREDVEKYIAANGPKNQ
jgi:predicted DNA-binding transcriptional regulator AlpA